MAFIAAEDETDEAELILFPNLYAELGNTVSENKVLVFTGNAEIKEVFGDESAENVTVIIKSVENPEHALASAQKALHDKKSEQAKPLSLYIKITPDNQLHLDDALAIASKGKGSARILVYFEAEKRLAAAKGKTADINDSLIQQLKTLMGNDNIAIK